MQGAVNSLADMNIFQSRYSRHSTMQKHHIIQLDGDIIYNPVDTEHYTPNGETLDFDLPASNTRIKVITAIWSPNPRKGGWRVPILAKANPDVDFIFIGSQNFEQQLPNLYELGKLDHQQMAQALRSGDIFLNLSENDPCPNIVLEAMASGLPVLYVPSGGTPELVGERGGLPIQADTDFRPQLERIQANLTEYQQAARQRTLQQFQKDQIFRQYLAVIRSAIRRPMPSMMRHWLSYGQMGRVWIQDKIVNSQDWIGALKG
jgi:glycosyltransferase involved in cell wall biosynthesis